MTVRVEDRVEPHLIVGEERNELFVTSHNCRKLSCPLRTWPDLRSAQARDRHYQAVVLRRQPRG